MNVILAHSIWTAVLLMIFIGIVVWAWSGRQRRRFEEAARIPLEDDDAPAHRSPLSVGTAEADPAAHPPGGGRDG